MKKHSEQYHRAYNRRLAAALDTVESLKQKNRALEYRNRKYRKACLDEIERLLEERNSLEAKSKSSPRRPANGQRRFSIPPASRNTSSSATKSQLGTSTSAIMHEPTGSKPSRTLWGWTCYLAWWCWIGWWLHPVVYAGCVLRETVAGLILLVNWATSEFVRYISGGKSGSDFVRNLLNSSEKGQIVNYDKVQQHAAPHPIFIGSKSSSIPKRKPSFPNTDMAVLRNVSTRRIEAKAGARRSTA